MIVHLVVSLSITAASGAALPSLKVSENRRFLVTDSGKPFFWLGDTAWELFHRLNREDAEKYLKNRAALHFTVIQAVALAEFEGLTVTNAYGQLPLENSDPTRPNEVYFQHVDWVVKRANEMGLYIGFLPTWGDKWNKKWGQGPEIFTPENAESYGEWIGKRYRNAGLVWILGGDRPVESDRQKEIVRAMARGLRKGDGGSHLITFHPTGGASSSGPFHDDTWLDFNMRQNGHGPDYNGRYDQTRVDYDRVPVKPVLDGEPIYEDHPVAFDAKRFGHSMASDVRRALYWDLFGGAFGHTYGHHSVWQMAGPSHPPVNNPLLSWTQAILQPGAAQMQYGRALMESRPFLTRIPDDSVIVPSSIPTSVPGAGRYRFVATRDAEGTYAFVYAPVGRPFSVRMDVIKGGKVKVSWYNPRNGKATAVGTFDNTGTHEFVSPDRGETIDWILVLDDAARKCSAPGEVRW